MLTSIGTAEALTVAGVIAPVSPSEPVQLPAAAIGQLFFSGDARPGVTFDRNLETPDAGAGQVTLPLNGATANDSYGPQRSRAVRWPGGAGSNGTRPVFDLPPPDATGAPQANGPGALFHRLGVGMLQ